MKYKIVIAGKNDIAVWALCRLAHMVDPRWLAVVPNKTDIGVNSWQKSLIYFAKQLKVKIISLDEAQQNAEIFISLEYDRIINIDKFKTKKLFNIHFSLLPSYKGMYTSIWPILNNEPISGCTLHKIDEGIDTGPIIDQESFVISDVMTSRDVYLKYNEIAIKLLSKNIRNILYDSPSGVKQSNIASSYYSKSSIDFDDCVINSKQTANQIKNFVRAFCFREYQMPLYKDRRVVRAEIIDNVVAHDCHANYPLNTIIATIDFPVILYFDKLTEILQACRENNVEIVSSLLKNIVNIEDKNEKGWTPLMVAAYYGSYEVSKFLIEMGADVNAVNNNGTTVLMYAKDAALRHGSTLTFNHLIAFGADIYKKDYSGRALSDFVDSKESAFLGLTR